MTFPCTACGLCCQHIGNIQLLNEFDRGDGVCRYFSKEVGCHIYEDRPVCCRVDDGYEVFASHLISKQEYLKKNAEFCNQLQEKAGMELIYRVCL